MIAGRLMRFVRGSRLRMAVGIAALLVFIPLLCAGIFFTAAVLYPFALEDLSDEAGAPLILVDRQGEVLRSVPSSSGRPGRAGWVPLSSVRSHAILALLASEDKEFYNHRGVCLEGIARAAWLNLKERRVGYGGSTITMQLVRMLYSQGEKRSLSNKIAEAFLALSLEARVSKNEILEQYVNRAYYGNGAWGIEAASQLYFRKPAAALSSAEAVFLSVIPRSPGRYNPLRNKQNALGRREHILTLLVDRAQISAEEKARMLGEPLQISTTPPPFRAPHFCEAVLASLPADIRKRGGRVHTTLDGRLQRDLEMRVAAHVADMKDRKMEEAGAVVLDAKSGAVLAMVGSADFSSPAGQLNIATHRRHPGSALKPFVYAAAIERGDTPATLALDIHDVPSRYRNEHLTQKEHGAVRYREALAGSYNLAAVHVLESVGEASLITTLRAGGIGAVPGGPDDYGLRLALGATKVALIDLAAGYGFMVNRGEVRRPVLVEKVIFDRGGEWRPPSSVPVRIFSEETSWLIADMLSDDAARLPAFGRELPVTELPFRAAFKTGTARGFSDTVTVGVTEQIIAAAWAGNFSGRSTSGVVGMEGAAPIVRAALLLASADQQLTLPAKPSTVVPMDICPLSGMPVSKNCPNHRREFFNGKNLPHAPCDWHSVEDGVPRVIYPELIRPFMERQAQRGTPRP